MPQPQPRIGTVVSATAVALALTLTAAHSASAIGEDNGRNPSKPGGAEGGAAGKELYSQVGQSKIVVKRSGGGTAKPATGPLASVDPNWKPPTCWYEPVATSKQLKAAVEEMTGTEKLLPVNSQRRWSEELLVETYDKGEPTYSAEGTKNYNLGEKGMFWRDVVRKGGAEATSMRRTAHGRCSGKPLALSPTTRMRPPPRCWRPTPTTRSASRTQRWSSSRRPSQR